jgi:hypothetical protein
VTTPNIPPLYLLSYFAGGALLVNAIPHVVSGLGQLNGGSGPRPE